MHSNKIHDNASYAGEVIADLQLICHLLETCENRGRDNVSSATRGTQERAG